MATTNIRHLCKCGADRSPEKKYCKDCIKLREQIKSTEKKLKQRFNNNMYSMHPSIEEKLFNNKKR